jgi:hypothetical protein
MPFCAHDHNLGVYTLRVGGVSMPVVAHVLWVTAARCSANLVLRAAMGTMLLITFLSQRLNQTGHLLIHHGLSF